MQKRVFLYLLFLTALLQAQDATEWKKSALIFTPEILVGETFPSNDNFPETSLHKQFMISIGRDHKNNPEEWSQRFKGLETGLSLGISDFGQLDSLGIAITALPYIRFNAFGSKRFSVITGIGASYFTEKYDPITNVNNRAVTTDLTWAFRFFLNYKVLQTNSIDWRIGLGYSHHSNGHTRLDNSGYNSILLSVSGAINNPFNALEQKEDHQTKFASNRYKYIEAFAGYGINVLAESFNETRPVYTVASEYGYVFNSVLKIGIGAHYRFYQHYYDYIVNNESLVQEGREFEAFKERPFYNASNLAVYANAEFLLNHFGIDIRVGYNIFKEAYQIDWRINEGWDNTPREIPEGWELGEFNSKYKLKKAITSSIGLKYYLVGTSKKPIHNAFIGAHINSNLGQADFTELQFGYVYSFGFN